MENAALRGTQRHRLLMGERVLVGLHAQLTGAAAADEVFIAAGAVVRLGAIVAPQARIPAGWVAAGDPARAYPPGQAGPVEAALDTAGWGFLPYVPGADDTGGRRDQLRAALARYTAAMARHHRRDEITGACEGEMIPAQAT